MQDIFGWVRLEESSCVTLFGVFLNSENVFSHQLDFKIKVMIKFCYLRLCLALICPAQWVVGSVAVWWSCAFSGFIPEA